MQNLVTVSEDELLEETQKIMDNSNIPVMYLKNNGDESHEWKIEDLQKWIND